MPWVRSLGGARHGQYEECLGRKSLHPIRNMYVHTLHIVESGLMTEAFTTPGSAGLEQPMVRFAAAPARPSATPISSDRGSIVKMEWPPLPQAPRCGQSMLPLVPVSLFDGSVENPSRTCSDANEAANAARPSSPPSIQGSWPRSGGGPLEAAVAARQKRGHPTKKRKERDADAPELSPASRKSHTAAPVRVCEGSRRLLILLIAVALGQWHAQDPDSWG